jgi:hypothetical protein
LPHTCPRVKPVASKYWVRALSGTRVCVLTGERERSRGKTR